MGRPKGSKNKQVVTSEFTTLDCQNGFKHLFTGDYAYLYDEVCKRAKQNVRTPLQELVAIVKRTVEISQLNTKKYGGIKDEKAVGNH